jgi:teichuronic acid biosynthesis glycosyltransferase TuaH
VTAPILRRAARRAARELGGSIDTVIAATLHDVFGLGESRRVLFATDDFIAGAGLMGVSEEWVRQREMSAARAADIVIAVSKPLASAIERRTGADVMVIENGVDVAHFSHLDAATPPPDVDLPRPIAGLVGQISERIDFGYLEAAAATGCSLLMIGPLSPAIDRNRFDDLQRRPNVQWVGAKSFESLPSYLSIVDVGLLPYEDSSFNRASFPLKVLEYLAAGLPVVSRDLPAVRQVGADVRLCSDPQTFAEAVLDSARTPSSDQAVALRRAAAEARSWDQVADRFARAIGLGEGDEPEATGGADHD